MNVNVSADAVCAEVDVVVLVAQRDVVNATRWPFTLTTSR